MPSRRSLLLGVSGILGAGIGISSQVHLGAVGMWSPPPDTWPHCRYDSRMSAANPNARSPTNPSIDWTVDPLDARFSIPTTIVVGRDAVYAAGSGVAAFDRDDGSLRWQADVPGGPLAVRNGTVVVAPGETAPSTSVAAVRAFSTDGRELWSRETVPGAVAVLITEEMAVVGGERGLLAIDAGSGRLKWATDSGRETRLLVVTGRLYAAADTVTRFRQQSLLDAVIHSPPVADWQRSPFDGSAVAMGANGGHLLVGSHRLGPDPDPALVSVDPDSGETVWGQYRHKTTGESPGRVAPLAVGPTRCFVALRKESMNGTRTAIAGHRVGDGASLWQTPIEGEVSDLALVDGMLIVATTASGSPAGGHVLGLDPQTGRQRWRVAFERGVNAVAPVDGRVFGAFATGKVFALS